MGASGVNGPGGAPARAGGRQMDRICRLLAVNLGVPMTGITLVDGGMLELVAATGLPLRAYPLEAALCGSLLNRPGLLVCPDTHADPAFRDLPMVVGDPFLRFYAGWRLAGLGGEAVGTLFAADQRPRPAGLTEVEQAAFEDFAVLATEALLREATAERLTERHARLEAHTRAIVAAIPLPLMTIDAAGSVTAWNPAAERVLGWTAAEAIGRYGPHVPPEERIASRVIQGPIAEGQRLVGAEVVRMRKDGRRIPVALSTAPLRDAEGRPDGAVVVLEDITARREAATAAAAHAARVERQLALLAEIAGTMPAVGGELGTALRRIAVAAAESMPGFDCGIWLVEAGGRTLSLVELVDRAGQPLPPEAPKRRAQERLPLSPEFGAALRSERDLPVEDTAREPRLAAYRESVFEPFRINTVLSSPIRVGQELLGMVSVCGAAAPRQYSPEERAFIASLADLAAVGIEARRRAETMQRLEAEKERAEAGDRAKSLFLGNLSHELRTPLNAIIGFAELLQMGGLPAEQSREFAEHVVDAGRHLLGVFNGMLEQARVDSGTLSLAEERVEPLRLLRSVVAMAQGEALLRRVTIREAVTPVPMLRGDAGRLRQALANLLGNAVKFSPEGGVVTLGLGFDLAEGFRLSVRDDGPGIDPADLPRALEPFRQLDEGLRRRAGGAGLGLPLAKAFAEAHGGVLEVVSAPGQGTTATLVLPASRAVDAADGASAH